MGIFDSVISLAGNVGKIVLAPVEVAVDLADAALDPIADAADSIVKDIKSIKD